MPRLLTGVLAAFLFVAAFVGARVYAPAALRPHGKDFADWRADRPGLARRIIPGDLPPPFATPATVAIPKMVARPPAAWPLVPPGSRRRSSRPTWITRAR
jgi:hypothetical protein